MLFEALSAFLSQARSVAPQPAEPTGLNWLVIGALVLIVLLWSPKKIPELAKSLGQAKREFDKALHEVSTNVSTPMPPDEQLTTTARRLGIATEGKSADQITQEIVSKSQRN